MTMKIFRFSQKGLVGHWRFNEGTGSTAYDSSPEGNNGTIHGASWVRGKFGYALKFDGSDDYVSASDSASLDITSEITIEAWIKPTRGYLGNYVQEIIVDKYYSDAYRFNICGHSGQKPGLRLFIHGTVFEFLNVIDWYQWQHVAATFDDATDTAVLYHNGDSHEVTNSASLSTSNSPLIIGRNTAGTQHFKGDIDEVRIYNRALSPEEIKIHYAFTKYIKPHFIIMRRKL